MTKYWHSGELGDIVYALGYIRAAGGGDLVVKSSNMHAPGQYGMLERLVKKQPYIHAFTELHDIPQADINQGKIVDLRHVIDSGGSHRPTIIRPYFDAGKVPFTAVPWLENVQAADVDAEYSAINITHRYRDGAHRWGEFLPAGNMHFIGLHDEYRAFIHHLQHTGYGSTCSRIIWIHTPDLLAAAQQIVGATSFFGNASSPLALAQGLGLRRIFVEVDSTTINTCLFGWERVLNAPK